MWMHPEWFWPKHPLVVESDTDWNNLQKLCFLFFSIWELQEKEEHSETGFLAWWLWSFYDIYDICVIDTQKYTLQVLGSLMRALCSLQRLKVWWWHRLTFCPKQQWSMWSREKRTIQILAELLQDAQSTRAFEQNRMFASWHSYYRAKGYAIHLF